MATQKSPGPRSDRTEVPVLFHETTVRHDLKRVSSGLVNGTFNTIVSQQNSQLVLPAMLLPLSSDEYRLSLVLGLNRKICKNHKSVEVDISKSNRKDCKQQIFSCSAQFGTTYDYFAPNLSDEEEPPPVLFEETQGAHVIELIVGNH